MRIQKTKLWSNYLLSLFVIGVILVPAWHKAGIGGVTQLSRLCNTSMPIGKNSDRGGQSRDDHNPATCLICRLASVAFASPTSVIIPLIDAVYIFGLLDPNTIAIMPGLHGLPPARAPPAQRI